MKKCYYCGKKMSSKEHIPPQQLFKGFDVNSITVYSCAEHNNKKSYNDDAIIKSMLMAIENSNNNLTPNIQIAVDNAKEHYKQVKRTVKGEKIYYDYNEKIICLDPSIDLDNWIRALSAAMIYYKIKDFDDKNKYKEYKIFERNSYSVKNKYLKDFLIERAKKIELQKLCEKGEWNNSWIAKSNYPEDLYFFKYKFIDTHIFFKHVFFKSFTYYNLIEISAETK